MTLEEAIRILTDDSTSIELSNFFYDKESLNKAYDIVIGALNKNDAKDFVNFKENELYQEIEIFNNLGDKIGEAEVELKKKMLSRLVIYEPYQNKGYGSEVVKILMNKYGCNNLWVNADNEKAIHVYEKNGFIKKEPKMYLMEVGKDDRNKKDGRN